MKDQRTLAAPSLQGSIPLLLETTVSGIQQLSLLTYVIQVFHCIQVSLVAVPPETGEVRLELCGKASVPESEPV